MTIKEEIVTGRKFRKLVDEATKLWQRISFWTKACDVEFEDGLTAEEKIGNLKFVSLTAAQYSIAAKDDNTVYFVTD